MRQGSYVERRSTPRCGSIMRANRLQSKFFACLVKNNYDWQSIQIHARQPNRRKDACTRGRMPSQAFTTDHTICKACDPQPDHRHPAYR